MLPIPTEKPRVVNDFLSFLKEYNIVSLAVAVVMGTASTTLVNSLVKDIVMPIISPMLAGDSWREASFSVGPVVLRYGSFLAEALNFLILAFVVFIIVKIILKKEAEKKA